jgi:ribosomal protein L21E
MVVNIKEREQHILPGHTGGIVGRKGQRTHPRINRGFRARKKKKRLNFQLCHLKSTR